MKIIGYWLGAISFVFLGIVSGADFSSPFLKSALILVGLVVLGITGLIFSVWLVYTAKQKEKENYRLLIEGRKSSLLKATRRICALKR